MKQKLERIIVFRPAYDKRAPEPEKNYGIGCATITMLLKGKEGAVQFYFSTGMHTPAVHKELIERNVHDAKALEILFRPMGYDLGYHSKKPMYKGHEAMGAVKYTVSKTRTVGKTDIPRTTKRKGKPDKCEFTGGKCYYDGSSLNAEPVLNTFLTEGAEAVWKILEKYYQSTFKK